MADDVKVRIKAEDKASPQMAKIGKSSKNMSATFKKAGMAMTLVGVALVGVMGKMVNSYAKAGDEVAKMAKRTGFGTEALSELRHAAELSGAQLGDIEKATKKMSKTIVDAGDGLETYVRVFEKLGLNVDELKAKKPEEQFWTIAEAMADLEDHTLKVAIAQDVFGRAGTNLLPMLQDGKEAIVAMREEAHALNLVFSEESAAAAEAFEDAKTRLKGAFTGISNSIAMVVMPKITELITALTEKLKPAIEWLAEHPEWIKWGAVAAGLTLIGGAMVLIIPKVIALIAALVTLHGLMGPAGWAKMAIGLGIAAATIAGLGIMAKKAFAGEGEAEEIPWYGPGAMPPPPPGKKYRQPTHEEWLARGAGGELPAPMPPSPAPMPPPGKKYRQPTHEEWLARGAGGELPAPMPPSPAPMPPSLQYGGIVRGPIGKPIPVIAHGGERFLGAGGGGITVNVYAQGSIMTERGVAVMVREELLHLKARNVTTGLA